MQASQFFVEIHIIVLVLLLRPKQFGRVEGSEGLNLDARFDIARFLQLVHDLALEVLRSPMPRVFPQSYFLFDRDSLHLGW